MLGMLEPMNYLIFFHIDMNKNVDKIEYRRLFLLYSRWKRGRKRFFYNINKLGFLLKIMSEEVRYCTD